MDKPTILIADSDETFRTSLADALRPAYRIRTAGEGVQAYQLLHKSLPDILVLDLMLPGMDGITLLQNAAQTGLRPMVLATTRFLSDYTLDAADRLGISYVMVKPCDVGAVASRIKDLSHRMSTPVFTHPEPRTLVSNTLLRLGVSTKLRGYGYLREAVLLMGKDPLQSITKELYPAVAAICCATAAQVERSVRSAVASAWDRCDRQIWQLYFPADDRGNIPRPTNATFISRLADELQSTCSSPNEE